MTELRNTSEATLMPLLVLDTSVAGALVMNAGYVENFLPAVAT
jgi:hypothetical protein